MTPSLTLGTATRGTLDTLDARLRAAIRAESVLDAAAQTFSREIFESFAGSVALARVYAIVPHERLPASARAFVAKMVSSRLDAPRIDSATPVLTLLGTHGLLPEWCDRSKSKGHVAIPLLDARFVGGIPMVARLLQELGVDLKSLDAVAGAQVRRLVGGFNGVFYVHDAATSTDAQGRLIVPAQDFVTEHGVRTVFGMGGQYLEGTVVAAIVFARETLSKSQAETFASLISTFKTATAPLVRAGAIFTEG